MRITKILSLVLAFAMVFSVFCTTTASAQIVNFKPTIDSGRMCGIAAKTPQTVLRDVLKKYSVEVFAKGEEIPADSTRYIGTGFTVKLNTSLFYSVVVMGDIDGDGEITSMDYLYVKRAVLKSYELSASAKRAAEVKEGQTVRAINYIKVKRAYYNTYDINKPYTCEPYESSNPPVEDIWSDGWV